MTKMSKRENNPTRFVYEISMQSLLALKTLFLHFERLILAAVGCCRKQPALTLGNHPSSEYFSRITLSDSALLPSYGNKG